MRRWIVGLVSVALVGYAVAATINLVFFPEQSNEQPPTPVTVTKTLTVERARSGLGEPGVPVLSKAEFQRRGNGICRTYTRKIRELGPPATRAAIEGWASLLKAQQRKLAALAPPTSLSTRYRAMLAADRAIPSLVLGWDAATRAGDTVRADRLEMKAAALANKRTRLARSLGLIVCAAQ